MKKLTLVFLAIALSGCVTQPTADGYQEYLQNTWIGRPESDLVLSWGAPTQSYEINGNKFITYLNDGGNAVFFMYGSAYSVRRTCKTTFEINNEGQISNFSFQGNMCRMNYQSPENQLAKMEKQDKEKLADCKKNTISGGFDAPLNCN